MNENLRSENKYTLQILHYQNVRKNAFLQYIDDLCFAQFWRLMLPVQFI